MPTFWVDDRIKTKPIEPRSDVTCQPLDHNKCDKICDMDSCKKQTRGKVLVFKQKALSFYTTDFSHINFLSYKIDQTFGFWVGQSLKLSRNTCFCGFKFFFDGELPRSKTWQDGPLKNVNFSLLSLKRCLYDNDFWSISLGDLSKILGAWNVF